MLELNQEYKLDLKAGVKNFESEFTVDYNHFTNVIITVISFNLFSSKFIYNQILS